MVRPDAADGAKGYRLSEMKWLVYALCLATVQIFSGCGAVRSVDVMQATGDRSPRRQGAASEEIGIKRAVYDDIIDRPNAENVVFALPDSDHVALSDYYKKPNQTVRPFSVISTRPDGSYFSAKERLPAASLSAEIIGRGDKEAVVLLSTSRGPRESVWRYRMKKTVDGWVVVSKELEIAS